MIYCVGFPQKFRPFQQETSSVVARCHLCIWDRGMYSVPFMHLGGYRLISSAHHWLGCWCYMNLNLTSCRDDYEQLLMISPIVGNETSGETSTIAHNPLVQKSKLIQTQALQVNILLRRKCGQEWDLSHGFCIIMINSLYYTKSLLTWVFSRSFSVPNASLSMFGCPSGTHSQALIMGHMWHLKAAAEHSSK